MEILAIPVWDWLITGLWRGLILALPLLLIERLANDQLPLGIRKLLLAGSLLVIVCPPLGLITLGSIDQALMPPSPAALVDGGGPLAVGLTSLLALWLTGVVILIAVHCIRRVRLGRGLMLHSECADSEAQALQDRLAFELGLRGRPQLRVFAGDGGACVFGLRRPVVFIPSAKLSNPKILAHALRHELTHVRRCDPWRQFALTLLTCLFWFNPLVYYASRRDHALRELACDASLSSCLGKCSEGYFQALLAMSTNNAMTPAQLHGFAGEPSLLIQRLRALESGRAQQTTHWPLKVIAIAALMVIVALGQTLTQAERQREEQAALAALATAVADGPGIGSMHVKFAAQRLAAARTENE